ncbi:PPE1 [Candida theae]|uniref:Protein phosphatase methylesterase 1 n=1 Tax=Candida theae TaxID=1198502 RepID=A0AAD5BFU2_9ASCO|nr:PPE1 [Candida theae]KAI5959987.1 PPE1 [Candida theae]
MSDLHKAFLQRVKKRESELGLSSLEEEEEEENESGTGVAGSTPRKSTTNKIDLNILSEYKQFKTTQFVTEEYSRGSSVFQTYFKKSKNPGPVLVCGHGAGSSSMTFAELCRNISDETLSVFLYDMKGHGGSHGGDKDFSLDTLVEDFHFVLEEFVSKHHPLGIFLLGHSLGGAIFAKYVHKYTSDLVRGLILLDIVEETAVTSLNVMPFFLEKLPKSFPSISEAINWHMNSLLFNQQSARLSVPDIFNLDAMTWKMDLKQTEPYWETWFTGLSNNFLSFPKAKLLILAAHETLDKKLTIGQMQGKYELVVFNNSQRSGHFVHEDLPKHVALRVEEFICKVYSPEKYMKDHLGIVPKWGGKIT